MRRSVFIVCLLAVVALVASGCPDKPSPAEAAATVDRFCSSLLAHDRESMRNLFSDTAWSRAERLIPLGGSTQVVVCRKERPTLTSADVRRDVLVSETDRNGSRAARSVYALTIARVARRNRIIALRLKNRFVAEGRGEWLMAGTEKDLDRVVNLSDLPAEFVPMGAPPGVSFGVGRDRFGVLALTPSADKVAFFTPGVHSFLGVADLRAKRITGIDLFFEGSGTMLAFSGDGRYLAAEVMTAAGTYRTTIYDLKIMKRVGPDLTRQFPIEIRHVRIESWDDQRRLHVLVSPAAGRPPQDIRQGERWIVDVIRGEAVKE